MIADISTATWVRILISNPILKKEVLEGFSLQPAKFSRMLQQPRIMGRLRRKLQTDEAFFEKIMVEWKQEQSAVVSYLAMLDADFLAKNRGKICALLGLERFCLGLYSLGLADRQRAEELVREDNAGAGCADVGIFDLLAPTLHVWEGFIEANPGLTKEFLDSTQGGGFLFDAEGEQVEQRSGRDPELKERFKKVEKKLQKSQQELGRINEQLNGLRVENEDLKKQVREFEAEFEKKLGDSLARTRAEWFERYQDLDLEAAAKEAARLESLLQRTRRALELQKRADEEYGLVSEIRAKLLEIDLSLARIEAVFADSLVVHKEVEKVKAALVSEKERLLKLPGIRRLIGAKGGGEAEIVTRINLIDPAPANLSGINKLAKVVATLSEIELLGDPGQLDEAVRHKKRQIMERLYARFAPGREDLPDEGRFRRLEDFVGSGRSRRYDLFIDGYNVLLRVHGEDEHFSGARFTRLREQFIEAVAAKSGDFARVYLVFDGVEHSQAIAANAEIIYTDKAESSADAAIIERINARKDKKILLVTGDEEIISSVQDRIFALIDVVAFYMFLFE
jgi:Skp family chaperone for outer membrane proteins